MKLRILVGLLLLACIYAVFFVVMPLFEERPREGIKVHLNIREPENGEYVVGDKIQINVVIENASDRNIYVVQPVNNSPFEMFPVYELQIEAPVDLDLSYSSYSIASQASHALIDTLQEKHFYSLKPGETVDMIPINNGMAPQYFRPIIAGEHKIKYLVRHDFKFYEINHHLLSDWSLKNYLRKIPYQTAISNQVTINVKSNGNTLDPEYHCLMGMNLSDIGEIYYNGQKDLSYYFQSAQKMKEKLNLQKFERVMLMVIAHKHVLLHFDEDNKVAGVLLTIESVPHDPGEIREEMLYWVRGSEPYPNESIKRNNGEIVSISAGTLAQ